MAVLPVFTADRIPFRALWPSGCMMPPKARVFADFLSRRLFPDTGERATSLPRAIAS
ncbi:TPA: hypothetical protein RZC51_005325 [Burkholderia cenocepacia]|uniref:hypothetical protein n=1 Tax=Burkholderia cenocepacia TaxID=95486 RepID=UPI00158D94AC|nr:hypothetical protein [Burkholderia cenocepacia]HEB3533758.1 hypothetical protein [Burkholderia cenocepacia]